MAMLLDPNRTNELCSRAELRAFLTQYEQLQTGKGLVRTLVDTGSIFPVSQPIPNTPPQYEQEAASPPWLSRLMAVLEGILEKFSTRSETTLSDPQLAAARRAIYVLAGSADGFSVRLAAIRHLQRTFSQEKVSAIKYQLNSLSVEGNREHAMHKLSTFEHTECGEDQDFLIDIATSEASGKDRAIAIEHVHDEATLAGIAILDRNFFDNIAEHVLDRLTDENLIAEIAHRAESQNVRCQAVDRLDDQKLLSYFARKGTDGAVRVRAINKLTLAKPLARIALRGSDRDVRIAAIERVDEPKILRKAALYDTDSNVRLAAVQRITDEKLLSEIALLDDEPNVRLNALERVQDQEVLSSIALNDTDFTIRLAAVSRVTNQHILRQVAESDEHLSIRQAAADTLSDEEMQKQIDELRGIQQAQKHAEVLGLAATYLQNLPIEISPDSDCGHTGSYEDVINALQGYGLLDDLGDDNDSAADIWDRVKPTHVDPLSGGDNPTASFIISVDSRQYGSEHFKHITTLNVRRVALDEYQWSEGGGTFDD